jgi:short-subunit dehydrogenase
MATTTRPRALVTGASAGIGTAFAERLAKDGYDLIVVARRQDRLDKLAKRLHEDHKVNVEVLVADLSKSEDMHKVEKHIAGDASLELLINNAGFGAYMPFVELDPDRAEESINLQVLAVTRLTRAALPGMVARGHGSIINVSSRLAFSGSMGSTQLAKRAVYAGAKSFVTTFSQLVQSELEGTGVQVQVLCPGIVWTEFHEIQGMDSNRYPAAIVMTAEDVVQASLKGLELGEVICVPALEDESLVTKIQEAERTMFDTSRTGNLATRYKA